MMLIFNSSVPCSGFIIIPIFIFPAIFYALQAFLHIPLSLIYSQTLDSYLNDRQLAPSSTSLPKFQVE